MCFSAIIYYKFPHSFAWMVTATAIGSIAVGVFVTNLYNYTASAYPTRVRAVGTGWTDGVGHGGAVAGPLIAGALFAVTANHIGWFLWFTIAGSLLPAGLLLFLRDEAEACRTDEEIVAGEVERRTVAVLNGIRVVVTGSAAALDMASLLLSDNGAEVIRVEPPGGDTRRGLPAWRLWNRGTRSIVLDPSVAADRDAASALIDAADVLLEAQGGAAGLGWSFGYQALAARNPGLVHCTVTAFGRSGELSWLPPYDGVVEARSGANVDLGVTLGRETPAYRARPNPSYGAANIAVQSIAAALLVRERDGRGQHIDTSLYQGLLAYDFSSALRRQNDLGELDPPLPATARRLGPFLPYLPVRCQDGQWMQITNNTARLFRHWMEVIGLAHIFDDPRWKDAPSAIPDPEAKVELAYLILDRMATRTFDEWLDIFLREGLTGDRFLTTQQALDHPQVIHNGSVVEVVDPEVGPTLQLGPTIRFADSPAVVPTAAPLLDADRAALLGPQRAARAPAPAADSRRRRSAHGQAAGSGRRPDQGRWPGCSYWTSPPGWPARSARRCWPTWARASSRSSPRPAMTPGCSSAGGRAPSRARKAWPST